MNPSILFFFAFAVAAVDARATFDKKSLDPTTRISSDEMFRLYEKAKKEVDEMNKKYPNATFEINEFSFMSETEKKKYESVPQSYRKSSTFVRFDDENIDAPKSFDWRDYGKVTAVRNQEQCGSCYAFAATAAVESQYLIQKNQTLDLSEEFVLECDKPDYECAGGIPAHALDLYKTSGVPVEECDPYTATNGTCPDASLCDTYFISGYRSFGNDEDKYPGLLFKYGPAAIAMLDGPPLKAYAGGVLNLSPEECGDGGHAVLLVGYTEDYWIAKNSWGVGKGEEGYFRFKRGVNFCNFTTLAEPVVPYVFVPEATTTAPSP